MSIPEDLAEIKLAAEIRKMAAPVGALGAGLGGLAGMAQAYLSDSDEDIQAPLSHRLKRYALRGLGGAAAGAGLEHMLRSKPPAAGAATAGAQSAPAVKNPASSAAKPTSAEAKEMYLRMERDAIDRLYDRVPDTEAPSGSSGYPGMPDVSGAAGRAMEWVGDKALSAGAYAVEKALPIQDAIKTNNLEGGAAGAIVGATLGAVAQPHISAAVKGTASAVKGTARKNIRADLAGDAVTSPLAKAVYDDAAKFNISDSPLAKLRRWTRGHGDVNDEISRFVDRAIDRILPRPQSDVPGRVAGIRANKPGARTVRGQENVKKSPLRSEVAEQIRADRAKYQQEKAKIVAGPKGEAAAKPDAAKGGKAEGGKSKGKTSKAAIVQRIQDAMKIRRPDSTDGVMKGRKTGLVVGGLGGLLQGLAYGEPPSKERLPVNLVPEEQGR